MTDCRACTRPTQDAGAVICPTCADTLVKHLASIPSWASRMEITRTRQSKIGARSIGVISRTEERPLPWDERASRAADALRAEVVGAVRILHVQGEPWPANTLPDMARWLLGHLQQWRRHEAAVEMWDSLAEALEKAESVVDREPDRQYLGICSSRALAVDGEELECDCYLYAPHEAHEVTCPVCGFTHDVAYRRRVLLAALDEEVLTATDCSRALSSLHQPVTPERIRKWAERKKLTPHGMYDPPRYKVADVRDLMVEAMTKRSAG